MLLLLKGRGALVRLPNVPFELLGAVEFMPGAGVPDGEMELPADEGAGPIGDSVPDVETLGWLVLAMLGAVGPLELVELDSA